MVMKALNICNILKESHNTYCVVPENIHTPPPTEGIGNSRGGGGVKGPGNSKGGGGGSPQKFFLFIQTGLNFHTIARKVLLFAF